VRHGRDAVDGTNATCNTNSLRNDIADPGNTRDANVSAADPANNSARDANVSAANTANTTNTANGDRRACHTVH
jgi:hypothetical protein